MMKRSTVVEQMERLEDQLQAIKWVVRVPQPTRRIKQPATGSVVTQTAGLLRGRLPSGRAYQRRLRLEWERHRDRKAS